MFLLLFVVTKYLQSLKRSIDFTTFFYNCKKNLQSTATMVKHIKEEVEILGGKATIMVYGSLGYGLQQTTNMYVKV